MNVPSSVVSEGTEHVQLSDITFGSPQLPEGWYCEKIYYVARDTPVKKVDLFVTGLLRFADGAAVRACLNMIQ
jgi:hypothetical protein